MNYETVAAYLAGECNEAEMQEIDSWRQANLRNEQDFQRWKRLWQASQRDIQDFKPDVAKAWQKVNLKEAPIISLPTAEQSPKIKERHLFTWFRNIAAILLLTAGLGWGVWKMSMPDLKWIEKTSVKAAKQEILLADGTHIWLNALSKIHYPERFNSDTREVFLEGEAYFEVAENPEKPFLVHSQGSLIQVLGTTFTVRSYAAEPTVEVNLLSGKVSFSLENTQPGQKVILLPGQKAILNKASQLITVSGNDNQNFLAWKTGKLAFQDVALREALQTLEAYYQVDFTVADSLLLNCRFTGSFDKAPLEDVLQVFAFGSDISYRKQGNQYVLSGKGCQ
jgi:ferric-dicitrate binding protein FerR (iron transport regulator)